MRLIAKILLVLFLILIIGFFLGPKASFEQVTAEAVQLNMDLNELETFITKREQATAGVKKNNESQFIWANSNREKTEYSVVYLHGFIASNREGFPIVQNFATRYSANLYLPRIAKHGLSDPDAMIDLTPKDLIDSAKEAIAVAKKLGEKVIIISTSTGSTYASYLANNDPSIYAQIMLSPNFAVADPKAKKITKRWGKQMFKQAMGGDYREWSSSNPKVKEYWQTKARIEGYIAMQGLVEQTMTEEVWSKNSVPTFIGYYYKDATAQDRVISIPAIQRYAEVAAIPKDKLMIVPFSDAEGHVIGSQFLNANWKTVQDEIFAFADGILSMEKKKSLVVTYPE